jgi:hypothetical protein
MTQDYNEIIEELFTESTSSIDELLDELEIRAINKESFKAVANKIMILAYEQSLIEVKKILN